MAEEISKKAWDWLRQKLKGMFSPLKGIMSDENASSHASSGYIKIIHVELLKSYADGVLEWDVDMRWNEPVRIYLGFNGESTASAQTVKFFIHYHPFANTADDYFYIKSLGDGKFDIYANKAEYQIFGVRQVDTQTYMADRVSITYPMTFHSSAVSGWTDATNRCWNHWLVTGDASTGLNVFESGVRRYKLEASINSLYARKYDANGTQTAIEHFCITEGYTMSGDIGLGTSARVVVPDRSTSYVAGANGNFAGIFAQKAYNQNHWYPAVALETKGGGSWQMGNYDNERLVFVYVNKANRDSNTNTGGYVYLEPPTMGSQDIILTKNAVTTYTLTRTSYCSSLGSYTWVGSVGRIVICNLNINITGSPASGAIIISGFPKPIKSVGFSMAVGSSGYRFYIANDGTLRGDGTIINGWYNGSVTYFSV